METVEGSEAGNNASRHVDIALQRQMSLLVLLLNVVVVQVRSPMTLTQLKQQLLSLQQLPLEQLQFAKMFQQQDSAQG